MAASYMRLISSLLIILSTSSFLLTTADQFSAAATAKATPVALKQQNSTQEPFSVATAKADPAVAPLQKQNSTSHEPFSAATARAPRAVECVHESSRNVIRRCLTWIVTVGPAVSPSGECCDAVRKARLVPCLCSYVTRDMEDLVSVNKLIRVFNSCGKRVRPGTQCASYIVPKA